VFNATEARRVEKREAGIKTAEDERTSSKSFERVVGEVADETESTGDEAMSERLWDVTEVAEFLGLAVGTVYHLLSQKRIPCARLSARCVRFDPRVIAAWVAQQSEQTKGFEFPRNQSAESTKEMGRKKQKAA
jgi:excisionase family DNA binding protein